MSGVQAQLRKPPARTVESFPGRAAIPARRDLSAVSGRSEIGSQETSTESSNPWQGSHQWSSWGNLWQIPSIVISTILIGLGVYTASGPAHPKDIDSIFSEIEQHIEAGAYPIAAERLHEDIEPSVHKLDPPQKGRFHVIAADLIFLSKPGEQANPGTNHRQVNDHYRAAVSFGAKLDPLRLERWAQTLLALGDLEGVQERLWELDALAQNQATELDDPTTTARALNLDSSGLETLSSLPGPAARNRVFQRLVEYSLNQPDLPVETLMKMLSDYQTDQKQSTSDELWALARQAQLRLEAGSTQAAIDFLLVEMRRLETRQPDAHGDFNFGELYTLLGRGYFELDDYDRAQAHLERALEQFHGAESGRGDALALLGQIALSRGEFDTAFEKFNLVVRDFVGTSSYLHGLLGQAEVQSILGNHEAAQMDYRLLRDEVARSGGRRRDLMPARVAQSLCERHDAALAVGKIELALQYAAIAQGLFPPDQVGLDVLFRLASTNRQIADNLIQNASNPARDQISTDPAIRYQANVHYTQAAENYLRYSRAQALIPFNKDDWGGPLWMAADSYDRGGRQDLAIQHFLRYLETRPKDDPRRAETLMRIAQAHHARLEYDKAIVYYEQIIADLARSTYAAQSYVPLARCYLAMGRRPEALQQLRQVVAGDRLLGPEARDYREALIELGRVLYQAGEFTSAIEQFAQAVQRYPDDPRRMELLFLLADSYRGNAMAIAEKTRREPGLSLSEMNRLDGLRSEHLQTAQGLFTQVCHVYGPAADRTPHPDAPGLGNALFPASAEGDMLRRAQLYRADCAFYLGRHDEAAELYDQVARRYNSHESSMYALIQVVNCYSALGDAGRSTAAHHRALVRLKQLPESAFAAPDALMDRSAWERWLENVPPGSTVKDSDQRSAISQNLTAEC